MEIDSVESLREHLQTAVEIEHATLPPYLCALYSIEDGSNSEAAEVIQSVVLEEMLHLTLAANMLNAVGGSPVLDAPNLLPAHPTFLPHSDRSVELSLRPFSPETLEAFIAVEKPGPYDGLPEDDAFETIGQFYRAIEDALNRLTVELGEAAVFSGDPVRQVTDAAYYGGAGRIVGVTDLESAKRALAEIIEQGEGATPPSTQIPRPPLRIRHRPSWLADNRGQAGGHALMDKGRLEAFSDGVIAIAITLLVLEIRVSTPTGGGADLGGRLGHQ